MATNNQAPFIISPVYTSIAVMYRNGDFIADRAMPRVLVGSPTFRYGVHRLGDWFNIPDTKVGRTSRPGQVETGVDEAEASTEDYAIDVPVPNYDMAVAPPNWDPYARAVEYGANVIALDREKRVSDILFNAANYATANKTTLVGAAQWSDGASNPYIAITDAMRGMLVAPTKLVIGATAYYALARHARILDAMAGTTGARREATAEQIAGLLGLSEIIVGRAKVNTAKKGQTPALTDIWGDKAALIVDGSASGDVTAGNSFAITAQFQTAISGTIEDPNLGMRGGRYVRTGEAVKELLTATDLGFLWSDVVA